MSEYKTYTDTITFATIILIFIFFYFREKRTKKKEDNSTSSDGSISPSGSNTDFSCIDSSSADGGGD